MHARGDQLVVEVGDLLVVERYALRHHQIIGGTIILDRLFGGDDPRLQLVDLAVEPIGGNARRIVFGAHLLVEIGVRNRVGDGCGFLRRFRTDGDVDEEGGALPRDLHPLLKDLHRSRPRGVFRASPVARPAAAEQQPLDRIEKAGFWREFLIFRQLQFVDDAHQDRDRLDQQRLALDGCIVGAEVRQHRLVGLDDIGAAWIDQHGRRRRI